MDVFCDAMEMKKYTLSKLSLPARTSNRESCLNEDTLDFVSHRDIVIPHIKETKLSGIDGVERAFPTYDPRAEEWNVGLSCSSGYALAKSVKRFSTVLGMKGVDSTRVICDDVHTIAKVFGIDAARKFLFQEISRLISFDGGTVDPRHVQLLVDTMTYSGKLTPVSRNGIPMDVGPNSRLMFEKCIDNAVDAAVFGELDTMRSVSSSVMFGTMSYGGTGPIVIEEGTGDDPKNFKTSPFMTKYEYSRLLSYRSIQLSRGMPSLLESCRNSTEYLEPREIAKREVKSRCDIPLVIVRVFPTGERERWNPRNMILRDCYEG